MRCAFFLAKGGKTLQESIVRFDNISMQFPGVLANDKVSFDIKKGEVFNSSQLKFFFIDYNNSIVARGALSPFLIPVLVTLV